jgi:hypothetical protein
MKNQFKKIFALAGLLALAACTKDFEEKQKTVTTAKKKNETNTSISSRIGTLADFRDDAKMYIVGYQTNPANGKKVATLWYNGQAIPLTSITNANTEAKDICVYNNNVYVVGYIEMNGISYPTLWKNGEKKILSEGCYQCSANAIDIDKNEVIHIAGIMRLNSLFKATYWRNGVQTMYTDAASSLGLGITALSDNKIRVLGQKISGMNDKPSRWNINNGTNEYISSTMGTARGAFSINNTDCIAVGGLVEQGTRTAYLWHNDIELRLENPLEADGNFYSSEALSGCQSGGLSFYSCGYKYKLIDNISLPRACFWNITQKYYLPNSPYYGNNNYASWAYDMKKTPYYTYFVGTAKINNRKLAKLWINSDEYYLSDGQTDAVANAIYVREQY